jgi:3-oxoacyl-[acyl-carrier-protein] synthase II
LRGKRVVATGLGAVAPNGIGRQAFWEGLIEGRSGVSRIASFDVNDLPTQIAGQVRDFHCGDYPNLRDLGTTARQTQFGIVATALALDDARVDSSSMESSVKAAFIGACNPAYDLIEPEVVRIHSGGLPVVTPGVLQASDPFATCSNVSRIFGFHDIARTSTTSCNSGLNAIGQAYRQIIAGRVDMSVAGGTDSPLSPVAFTSFCGAHFMSRRNDAPQLASRPFDRLRDGGVLAEGAAIVLLEELEHALMRRAPIYCEIIAYSERALSVTRSRIEESLVATINAALADGHVAHGEIDYICAHGPSDPLLDRLETQAIKTVFGKQAYRIPISSIKSMIGNPLSAAGALQFIASALVVTENIIPPTINQVFPDPSCDLDYVPNRARKSRVETAMVLTHGLNGADACVILRSLRT